MYIKSGALLIVALIPLTSVAAKGDFDFSISGKNRSEERRVGKECPV